MKTVWWTLLLFFLFTAFGCGQNDHEGAQPRADAPPFEAPKGTVGIEAPSGGSSTDARILESRKPSSPPSDPQRKYRQGVSEKELILPFYPGSKELRPGGVLTDASSISAQSFRITGDQPSAVVEFYKKKLDIVHHEVHDASSITITGKRGDAECTIIVLRRNEGTEVNVFTKRPKG